MALALSPLSQVCKGIRAYLDGEINAPTRSKVTVVLATPAETASAGAGDSEHRLNLFFYRFEPPGLFPDILPGETGWLRTFCLITPFAVDEEPVGAGENDLRLLGEVIRIFHERPVHLLTVDGEEYHLQVIFQPLGLDQLNQLWSTQGDTIYRPSALFEISLTPVVPATKAVSAPLTGGFGLGMQATMERREASAIGTRPEVPVMNPDTAQEAWAPAIAFVHQGACALSLGFAVGSAELAAFVPRVWIAGKVGASVTLRWETWAAAAGWQTVDPAVAGVVASAGIDPNEAAGAVTQALTLPFADHAGQLMLYAERSYTRASDGVVLTVRSNPLLINLYGG